MAITNYHITAIFKDGNNLYGFYKYCFSSGTRTWKKVPAAEKKLDYYYSILGKLA